MVLLPPPSGPTKFRTTIVKPFLTSAPTRDNGEDTDPARPVRHNLTSANNSALISSITIDDDREPVTAFTMRTSVTSRIPTTLADVQDDPSIWKAAIPQSTDNAFFAAARIKEFNGLLDRGVFTLALEHEAAGYRVYGCRFVYEVKQAGTPSAYAKSRMVVQAFNDNKHGVMTGAPTVQRGSQHLALALIPIDDNIYVFLRDVDQAYTQAKSAIRRAIFIRPPLILNIPPGYLLRVDRPLYGLPESGMHWFVTYHGHHRRSLHMAAAIHDPCLLYTRPCLSGDRQPSSAPRGITCLQTDDTLHIGNEAFLAKEEKLSREFKCKPKAVLAIDKPLKFNGGIISLERNAVKLSQPQHIAKLSTICEDNVDISAFTTQRARGAYIASMCRPDFTYRFAACSQVVVPKKVHAKRLNEAIESAKEDPNFGLSFVRLDPSSLRVIVFADASFASNEDLTSQLGFVIGLADKHGNANIVHYSSFKSKRVTRSVLAAELFAVVHAFDYASTLRNSVSDMLGRQIAMTVYTDSKSLYDAMTGIN